MACGTPAIFARQVLSGFAPPGSIRLAHADAPDVQPLWFDQNPRLLHAEHTGGLALDNLLVLGDVETLSFEHWSTSAGEVVEETWQRTRTTSIDGYLISVFNPSWDDAELWDTIGPRRRGFDRPYVYFGSVTVPSTDDGDDDNDDDETFSIRLSWASRNVPSAQVTRIDDKTQYASHVVNLVISDSATLDWRAAATASIWRARRSSSTSTFGTSTIRSPSYPDSCSSCRTARSTATCGTSSAVSAPSRSSTTRRSTAAPACSDPSSSTRRPGSGVTSTSTHEIGHQWLDYWDWSALGDGVERAGHQPESHTPLLYPGEVYTGAVLGVTRRVAAGDDGASYAIERTPTPACCIPRRAIGWD